MRVYIEGLELPEDCFHCKLLRTYSHGDGMNGFNYNWCSITKNRANPVKRNEDCPLKVDKLEMIHISCPNCGCMMHIEPVSE